MTNRTRHGDASPNRVSAHYAGESGRAYAEDQAQVGLVRGRLLAWKFRDHVSASDTLLDFGAGDGSLLAALTAKTKIAVEPNAAARTRASQHVARAVPALDEVESASIDVLVSNHALEHTLAPAHELRECSRVLRPGGTLVLCVPIDDWRHERRFRGNDPDRHLYTWTPLLLGNLLTEVGFEVHEIRILTGFWPPGFKALYDRLGERPFIAISWLWGFIRRRREMIAVARTKG